MKPLRQLATLAAAALTVAACGSSHTDPAAGGGTRLTRGAVTAKTAGAITVNGVVLSTAGVAAVRVDDDPSGTLDDVKPGDVVRVKGTFDDRAGAAVEIEVEHGIEGRVEGRGADFLVVGGQRIQVDDTTHLDDRLGGLDGVGVGSIVRVSGTPVAGTPGAADDRGGLRASRLDRSPRQDDGVSANDDDLDVKGFVSALDTALKTFQLRATPDAAGYFAVSYAGIALPAGVTNGAAVEVHTATAPVPGVAPVIASLVASAIHLEDRLAGGDVEVEGYVTSIAGDTFVVAGVTVSTSGATRWELGAPADLVVGAKVEVEGLVDASGVLHAERVSFRAGVRITSFVEAITSTSMTILGVSVQLPPWLDNDLSVPAIQVNDKVEVRGNPSASGAGVVASRLVDATGNADRVFLRAVVTARAGETLTVLGFAVTPPASTNALRNADGSPAASRAAWFAAIEPGRTIVKVRANVLGDVDVGARTWMADELELEGNE